MEEITKISLSEVMNRKKDDSFNDFKHMMINHKFDFDEQEQDTGKTLLMLLIESQSPTEFLWFALEYFSDPNLQDKQGNTALHYAFASPNRYYLYILLLFNADSKIKNLEGKEPHQVVLNNSIKEDEIFKLYDLFDSLKLVFARITRQRRDYAREIFTFIEGSRDIKGVNLNKLAEFNKWLNDDDNNEALNDANAFFEESRLNQTSQEIYYEEYIISLTKIAKMYGISKVDEFFEHFKKVLNSGKKFHFD